LLTNLKTNRYHTKKAVKAHNTHWFVFQCSQSQSSSNHKPKKLKVEEEKQRIVCHMERFECGGWLYVTPHASVADVAITHCCWHKHYVDITIPEKWCIFIEDNHRLGPAKVCAIHKGSVIQWILNVGWQIWQAILSQMEREPVVFTQKSVRHLWVSLASDKWQQVADPMESAQKYIHKFGNESNVKIIELSQVEGARSFAFIVTDFMHEWAVQTDTFLVDSMCKWAKS